MQKYVPGFTDPRGTIMCSFGGYDYGLINEGTAVPADGTVGYEEGALFFKRSGTAGAQLYINEGSQASCAFKALPSQAAGGLAALAVAGVAAGYKLARGATALDGSNPTPVATGLTTIVAAVATLQRTTGLNSGTALVTVDFTGTDGTLNLYGWVVAGTASTGTETVNWIAIGT